MQRNISSPNVRCCPQRRGLALFAAFVAVACCSCRAPQEQLAPHDAYSAGHPANAAPVQPVAARRAMPGRPAAWSRPCVACGTACGAGGCQSCGHADMPWTTPAIDGTWSRAEYLCDGGDERLPAQVNADWTVHGVEPEDTIAHYDTLDGSTKITESNKVCIYAPRFGAVRRVDGLYENEGNSRVAGFEYPMKANLHDDLQIATTAIQPEQPVDDTGTHAASIYRLRQQGGGLDHRVRLAAMQDALLPYEDFQVIRHGVLDNAEKVRLAIAIDAAITWSGDQSVQIILDNKAATEVVEDKVVGETFSYDHPSAPCLRILKIASTDNAAPGEIVEFTLRYDNVGNEVIGNVVILDNLTTRLEYVPDSQQSSRPAEFTALPNEAGSSGLRWELKEPLPAGEGGIIRFKTLVR